MPSFVRLYKAIDSQEAALVAMKLEGHGIRTRTVGEGASIGYGGLTAGLFAVEIWDPEDRLLDAQALIKDHLAEAKARGSAQPEEIWTCAECGKSNEGDFALCWSCQAVRP